MPDVIVVGARVAGSATAMLLARQGLDVLVVDRASFPSDTLSTHQIQVPGVARLARWGLLERLLAGGTPPTRHVSFDACVARLEGCFPEFEGVDAMLSPRRTLLDAVLVDAARDAGAEVREGFPVEEVLIEDGRVTGIRGRGIEERAPLVIGADGKHSLVAKAVGAPAYNEKPALSIAYYTYWEGVEVEGGEMVQRPRRAVGVWPTNDGLVLTYVACPHDEFHAFKADVEGNFLATLDLCGDVGERFRAGRRADRFYGTADLPNRFRRPYGPGWALVGDAGLVMDPITGRGIGDAFRDAELLAGAIVRGDDLALYEQRRNEAALPDYELATRLASFEPQKPEERLLFEALARRPEDARRFLGVLTGSEPMADFFTAGNLKRILGVRGMAKLALGKIQRPPRPVADASRAAARSNTSLLPSE
ncbi:MAG TPA: NAD(P)/FAD-dependent oxidoreductase [Gaiellaceae bacterium]